MSASYELRGSVAVITLNNPPVNGLGYATRVAVAEGLDKAQADASVTAVVITGAGKAFSGGADIKEFGSPKAIASPNLLDLIRACELCSKPVVAAVHSVCMGGGLELSLGCHYRVASAGANVALPRGEDRPDPGRGRHAAPAAGAGRGNRAEHDRHRRPGQERVAGQPAGPEAV